MGTKFGSMRHKALVEFLIAKRESIGIAQTELANQMGEYQSFVAWLENGRRRIVVFEYRELSKFLDFDPAKPIKLI